MCSYDFPMLFLCFSYVLSSGVTFGSLLVPRGVPLIDSGGIEKMMQQKDGSSSKTMENHGKILENHGKIMGNHGKSWEIMVIIIMAIFGHFMVKLHLNNIFNILIDFSRFILVE